MRKKQRLTEDPKSLSKQLQNSKNSSINQISVSEDSMKNQENPFEKKTDSEQSQNLNQIPYTSNFEKEEKKSSPFPLASQNSDDVQHRLSEQLISPALLPQSQSQPDFRDEEDQIRASSQNQENSMRNEEVKSEKLDFPEGFKGQNKKNIQLFVRVRPHLEQESTRKCLEIDAQRNEIRLFREYQKTDFKFDGLLLQHQKQPEVFAKVQNIVQKFLQGSNGTIFAYGQTGAGKTFTIVGKTLDELQEGLKNKPQTSHPSSPSLKKKKRTPSGLNLGLKPKSRNSNVISQTFDVQPRQEVSPPVALNEVSGVIPRSIELIFSKLQKNQKVRVGFIEIYNDKVYDLLNSSKQAVKGHKKQQSSFSNSSKGQAFNMNISQKAFTPNLGTNLEIREERDGSFSLPEMLKTEVRSEEEAMRVFQQGLEKRQTQATVQNAQSSRSHSIFQVFLEDLNGQESYLRIVDLAGSEKYTLKKDLAPHEKQQRVQELTQINSSLSALGQCVSALGDLNRKHIPYRNSKLTKILKDSLDEASYIALIVCISPSFDSYKETFSTLQFADRAKKAILDGRQSDQIKLLKASSKQDLILSQGKEKEYQVKIKELQDENYQLVSQIKELKSSSSVLTQDKEQKRGILVKEGREMRKGQKKTVKFAEKLLNEESIDEELKERIEHNLMYNDDRIFDNISIFKQDDDSVVQEKKQLPLNDFHPLMLIKKKQQEAGSLIDRIKDKKLKKFWKEGEAPPIEDSEDQEEEEEKLEDKKEEEEEKLAVHVSMSQEIGGSGGSGGNLGGQNQTKEIFSPEISGIQTAEKEQKAFKNLTNLSSVENDKSGVGLMSSMLFSMEVEDGALPSGTQKEESMNQKKDCSTINNLSQICPDPTSPRRMIGANTFEKKRLAVEQQMGVSPIQEISSGSFSRDLLEIAAQKKGKKEEEEDLTLNQEDKNSLEFDTLAQENKKPVNPDLGEVSAIIKAEISNVYSNKSDELDVMAEEEEEEKIQQKLISFPSQLLEESGVNAIQESMIINEGEAVQGDTLLLDSNSIILDTGGEVLRPDASFDTSKIKDFLSPRSDAFFDAQNPLQSQASGEDQMFTYSLTNTFSTLKSLREGIESQRTNSKTMKQIHKFAKEQQNNFQEEDQEDLDFQNKREKFENYTKQFYDQILKEIVTLKQLLLQNKEQALEESKIPLSIKVMQRQKLKHAKSVNMGIQLNSPAKQAINNGLVQAKQELHKALKTKQAHQGESLRLRNLLKLLESLQNELKKPLARNLTLSNQKQKEIIIPSTQSNQWVKSPKNQQQQSPSMNLMINSHQHQPNGDLGESAVMEEIDQTKMGQSQLNSGETPNTGKAFQFPNFHNMQEFQLRNSKVSGTINNITHDSVAFESEVNLIGSSLKKQTLESHQSRKNLHEKQQDSQTESRSKLKAREFLNSNALQTASSQFQKKLQPATSLLTKSRQTPVDLVLTDPTQQQSFGQQTNPFLAKKEGTTKLSARSSIGTENALPHLIGGPLRNGDLETLQQLQDQEGDKTLLLHPSQDSTSRRRDPVLQELKSGSLEELSGLEESGISPLLQGSPGLRDDQGAGSFAFMLQSMIQMSKDQKFEEKAGGVIHEENSEEEDLQAVDISKFGASIDQSSLLQLNIQEGQTQFLVRQSPVFRAAVKQMQEKQKKQQEEKKEELKKQEETEWKPMPKLKSKKKQPKVQTNNFFQEPIKQTEYINRNAISPKAFETKSNNASAVMEEEESHKVPPMQTKNQKIFANPGGSSKGSVKKYWKQFFEQQ